MLPIFSNTAFIGPSPDILTFYFHLVRDAAGCGELAIHFAHRLGLSRLRLCNARIAEKPALLDRAFVEGQYQPRPGPPLTTHTGPSRLTVIFMPCAPPICAGTLTSMSKPLAVWPETDLVLPFGLSADLMSPTSTFLAMPAASRASRRR